MKQEVEIDPEEIIENVSKSTKSSIVAREKLLTSTGFPFASPSEEEQQNLDFLPHSITPTQNISTTSPPLIISQEDSTTTTTTTTSDDNKLNPKFVNIASGFDILSQETTTSTTTTNTHTNLNDVTNRLYKPTSSSLLRGKGAYIKES